MSAARTLTAGVVLADGRVLIAGGQSELVPGAAAVTQYSTKGTELFNLARGQWQTAGSMGTMRKKLAMVRLVDGRVLAIGGISTVTVRGPGPQQVLCVGAGCTNVLGVLNSAEVYSPATDAWTAVGHMRVAREWPTATRLADGSVLVTGGASDSAERFDPRTDSWSDAGTTRIARLRETATLLGDGRVLVCGGYGPHTAPVADCEIYDPTRRTWTRTGDLVIPVADHTATLLADGRVLVVGGETGPHLDVTASAQLWSPATGVWTRLASLRTARASAAAVRLVDDTVLICGGLIDAANDASSSCERLTSADTAWKPGPGLNQGRFDFVMLAVASAQGQGVLAVGGSTAMATEIKALGPFNDVQPTATVERLAPPPVGCALIGQFAAAGGIGIAGGPASLPAVAVGNAATQECHYRAQHAAGFATGRGGNWQISVRRTDGTTDTFSPTTAKSQHCGPVGTIRPGDEVSASLTNDANGPNDYLKIGPTIHC